MAVLLLFVVLATVLLLFLFRLIFAAVLFCRPARPCRFRLGRLSPLSCRVSFPCRGFILSSGGVEFFSSSFLGSGFNLGPGFLIGSRLISSARSFSVRPLFLGFILKLLDPFVVGFVFVPVRLLGEFRKILFVLRRLPSSSKPVSLPVPGISDCPDPASHFAPWPSDRRSLRRCGGFSESIPWTGRFRCSNEFRQPVLHRMPRSISFDVGSSFHLGRRLFGLGGRRCVRRSSPGLNPA